MNQPHISNRRRQSGAILIVSLLLLLVLTVLGVVMMQTTRMQERMAGATRDLSASVQGAESGLRYGETVVSALASPDGTGTLPCTVCQPGTLPVAIYDPAQFDWNANATPYGTGGPAATLTNSGLNATPRYTVESLGFVRDSLDQGQEPPEGRDFFQISSRSTGATGLANTVLQSTYARRF